MKKFKPTNTLTLLTVEGNCSKLRDFCKSLKAKVFLLDLTDVDHCDSAGLAFLIEARRMAVEYKKTCTIDCDSKAIADLAEFCGVKELLGV